MSLYFFLWQLAPVKLVWLTLMAKLYIIVLVSLDFFRSIPFPSFILTNPAYLFHRSTDPIHHRHGE